MRLVIYKRKYCVYWREGTKPKRHSLRTADRATAEYRFKLYQQELGKKRETVGDIFPIYIKEKYPFAEWNWKQLKPFWENIRPDDIDREDCKRYIEKRRKQGIKNGTIHRELTMLRAAVRWNDPKTKAIFELPQKPPPRDLRLTKKEAQKLIQEGSRPHVQLFIVLALTTAARTTAILELTWDKIDFEGNRIILGEGKRLKGRATVPMNDTAKKMLLRAKKASLTDYVIELGGKPLKSIRKGVVEAGKRVGLKVSPHMLRHTAACLMAEAGIPINEISQFLGHSSPDITFRVYARYSPEYLKKASTALEFDVEALCEKEPV